MIRMKFQNYFLWQIINVLKTNGSHLPNWWNWDFSADFEANGRRNIPHKPKVITSQQSTLMKFLIFTINIKTLEAPATISCHTTFRNLVLVLISKVKSHFCKTIHCQTIAKECFFQVGNIHHPFVTFVTNIFLYYYIALILYYMKNI